MSRRVAGSAGLVVAEVLREHGVSTLFTLSGGHLFSLFDGCVQTGIRLVDTRHEQTATFAAEGWAKVTRRVGAAALTAGPGVTNGVSAITSAWLNGSPVLVLGGRAPGARWGAGSLQELDHVPIVASVTKRAGTLVDAADAARAVTEAVQLAGRPHRGPVFLDLPLDVVFAPTEVDLAGAPAYDPGPGVPDEGDLERVAALLDGADRPVLVAGGDVYWASAEVALRTLAEHARLPVLANGLGRGCLAADHELFFSRARAKALREADLVVVAGTPLDFRLGFGDFGGAAVVHLCDAPERVGTHARLAASAVGDLRLALDALAALAGAGGPARDEWMRRLRGEEGARRRDERELLEAASTPVHPARVYGELAPRLDRDAIVVGDGGDFVSFAGKYLDTFVPGCFLDPGPYGCLGSGPGYALAAALAHPQRQVVLVLGDGAAGFSLGDWDTLVRFGARVVAIVGNNGIWGLEKHPMQLLYGYDVAAELRPGTRYDLVAEALGAAGELVEEPGAVGPALDRALARDGFTVLNVLTDPAVAYPRTSNLA